MSGKRQFAIAKSAADPAGHYSRLDLTRLLLNGSSRAPPPLAPRGPATTLR